MGQSEQCVDPSILRKQKYAEENNKIRLIDGFPVFTILELNIYGACNRSCSFCPVSDPKFYTNRYEGISVELYTKIIKELKVAVSSPKCKKCSMMLLKVERIRCKQLSGALEAERFARPSV